MAITYGFYNSLNHDRVYDAKDFSEIFNGIINDGVFQSVGTGFTVTAGSGSTVKVGIGRAWLNGTWTHNDAVLNFDMGKADLLYPRYDALVIEVNETTRINALKIVSGTAKTDPVKPALTKTTYVHQYPLCYIKRKANNDTIVASEIENRVGLADLPWVTGILKTIDMDVVIPQWRGQLDEFVSSKTTEVNNWFKSQQTSFTTWTTNKQNEYTTWITKKQGEFDTWYANIQKVFNQEAITNLQTQIDDSIEIGFGVNTRKIVFGSDGSITETGNAGKYDKKTTFNSNGSITEVTTRKTDNAKKTTTITFNTDGSIQVTTGAWTK